MAKVKPAESDGLTVEMLDALGEFEINTITRLANNIARYANRIMKMVKELDGIHTGGININNILCADDTTLIADSEAKLQNLHNAVVMESEQIQWSVHRPPKCMVYGYIKIIEHSALKCRSKWR